MNWNYYIQRFLLWCSTKILFRLTVKDADKIPVKGPLILASNHASMLDPPLAAVGSKRQLTFLAKEELFKIPLFGFWIRSLGARPVNRHKGDAKAVRTVLRLLGEGKAILIFPEGTRTENGDLLPFENGLAWLAIKSGAPVVPMYISGSYESMARGSFLPKPKKIRIRFGDVIAPDVDEKDVKKAITKLTALLEENIKRLKFDTEKV